MQTNVWYLTTECIQPDGTVITGNKLPLTGAFLRKLLAQNALQPEAPVIQSQTPWQDEQGDPIGTSFSLAFPVIDDADLVELNVKTDGDWVNHGTIIPGGELNLQLLGGTQAEVRFTATTPNGTVAGQPTSVTG